jgi:uncharacterized protein (DUF2062 family)
MRVKELWGRLVREDASPDQIALGFAMGMFVRFLPIPWVHTITALVLAFVFRINRVASLVGVELYLPFIWAVPLLYVSEYYVGSRLIGLRLEFDLRPDREDILELISHGWDVALALFIGAVVIGLPVAVVSFFVVRKMAKAWQANRKSPVPVDGK